MLRLKDVALEALLNGGRRAEPGVVEVSRRRGRAPRLGRDAEGDRLPAGAGAVAAEQRPLLAGTTARLPATLATPARSRTPPAAFCCLAAAEWRATDSSSDLLIQQHRSGRPHPPPGRTPRQRKMYTKIINLPFYS